LFYSIYFDPLENFPDKIDQLFEALNRVRFAYHLYIIYMEKQIPQPNQERESTADTSIVRHSATENSHHWLLAQTIILDVVNVISFIYIFA
jgi:hypothetical protein